MAQHLARPPGPHSLAAVPEERQYTVPQELGSPVPHSNPHIPPCWKEARSVSPSLLWGWEAANVLRRPSPNKAPHTNPAKGPDSSLLIAILASEPTRGKQRGPYFSWWTLNALLRVPICLGQPLLMVERNPEPVSDLLLLNLILWQAHQTPEEVYIHTQDIFTHAGREQCPRRGRVLTSTPLFHTCKLCSIWARE